MVPHREVPTLVDLTVNFAIDNLRYLGDVGETDPILLERILPHCTLDQLMHVEKSTQGRDLSPITDKLWKKFYEKKFGEQNTKIVIERMRRNDVSYKWMQLYEAKLKDVADTEKKALDQLAERYKNEDARKQSKQIRLCTKVPPSSKKRSICGGGTGYNVSNRKSNLMKKAKIDLLKSVEVKNLAAMKKNSIQRNNSSPSPSSTKARGLSGNGSCSTSIKPAGRRL